LIWFGWDDPNIWKTRRDNLFESLLSNPKAKFVTRVLQFGSEPLYDWALDPAQLTEQVKAAKVTLASLQVPVTISEMAYGYQKHNGATDVLAAIDVVDAHILPFFASDASTGESARG
jgi:exo-beta-1,3-glucanase (GH17 family)